MCLLKFVREQAGQPSSVRLLRPLSVCTNMGRTIYEKVRNPPYMHLASTDTAVVEINVNLDDGEPVPFKGGKVTVKVHVRKRR